MDRLQVMAVINGLGTGGAERSLAEMIPLLRDRGIDIHIVCSYQREQGVEKDVVSQGSRVTHLKRTSFPGRILELRRLILAEQPNLIHTTIIESDILGRLAAIGSGIPVLTSLVNTSYDPVRFQDPSVTRWRLEAVRLIDGFTARHFTAAFHAISNAVADDAVTALGISKSDITVIGRARDLRRLGTITPERRTAVRERLGLSEDDQIVITVGRQEWQKGQIVLVEAAASLVDSHPHLKVLLVGREGSETQTINQRIVDLGLRDVVLSLGHRDDVPDLLAASDVFAFPSLFEGLGGALLEALALGLPCVVSDVPALLEREEAHLIHANSWSDRAWSRALAVQLDDPGATRNNTPRDATVSSLQDVAEATARLLQTLSTRVPTDGHRSA